MAGAVGDAFEPDVAVQIIHQGDRTEMPDPPNPAVDDRIPGKDVTAARREEILAEPLPE